MSEAEERMIVASRTSSPILMTLGFLSSNAQKMTRAKQMIAFILPKLFAATEKLSRERIYLAKNCPNNSTATIIQISFIEIMPA